MSEMTPMLRDPRAWRLRVDGLVRQPLELSIDDLMRLPRTSDTVKHHCVERWSAVASWHGAPVAAVVERCQAPAAARDLDFPSCDAGPSNGGDMAAATHPRSLRAHPCTD